MIMLMLMFIKMTIFLHHGVDLGKALLLVLLVCLFISLPICLVARSLALRISILILYPYKSSLGLLTMISYDRGSTTFFSFSFFFKKTFRWLPNVPSQQQQHARVHHLSFLLLYTWCTELTFNLWMDYQPIIEIRNLNQLEATKT
jgi:hypothetical protein